MKKLSLITSTFAALAMSSHAALSAGLCEGSYESVLGSAKPPISGVVPGVTERLATGEASVEVKECGRVLILRGAGMEEITTVQRSNDDHTHYSGIWAGQQITQSGDLISFDDGKVDIDILPSGRITGQFFLLPDTPGSWTLELNLIEGQAHDMAECEPSKFSDEMSSEDRLTVDPEVRADAIEIVAARLGIPPDKADHYISAARTVAKTRQSDQGITEIMPGEPGCPVELTGVKTCRVFPPEITAIVEVNVLLDTDGKLLPIKSKASDAEPIRVDDPMREDICTQETEYPPADQRLRFMFFSNEEDGMNDVQAAIADADTSKLKRAHYAKGNYNGHRGRSDAADEAYYAVGAPVTGRH